MPKKSYVGNRGILRLAFTLAETLVALAIIGVLAALTVPGLLNSTNDQELSTARQKVFADLQNAINLMRNDNGGTLVGVCGNLPCNNVCIRDTVAQYLNVVKKCNAYDSRCFVSQIQLGNTSNFAQWDWVVNGPSAILNNGVTVGTKYFSDGTKCTGGWSTPVCVTFEVDVNGFKEPNVFGKGTTQAHKDIFQVGFDADGKPYFMGGSL